MCTKATSECTIVHFNAFLTTDVFVHENRVFGRRMHRRHERSWRVTNARSKGLYRSPISANAGQGGTEEFMCDGSSSLATVQ